MATIIRSKVAAATKATTTTAPTNLIHNINKLTRVVVDEVGEVKLYDGEKVVKSIDLGVAHSNLVHTLQIEIPCAAFRHKTPEDYNIFLNYKKEPNGTAGQMELVNTNWGSFAGKYIYYYKVPRTPFTETPGANFIFDIKLEAITAGNNAADEKEVWYSRTFGGATSSVSTIIPTIADLTLPENGVVDSGSGLIKKDIDVVLTDTGFEVGRKDLEYIAVADDKYARRFKFTNCDISRDYYVICTNNTESLTALKVIHDNVSGSYCWIPSNITSVSGSYWFMVAAGGGVGESDELWTSEPVLLKVVSRVGEDNNVVLTSNTEEIKTASDNSVIVQNPNGVYDLEMTGAELKSKLTAIDSAATMEYVSNALSNAGGVVSVDVLPPIEAAQENVIYGVQENDLDALFTVQEGYVKTADGAITFTQYVNNFFGDQGIEIQKTNWIVVANHDEIVKDILEPVGDSTSLMNWNTYILYRDRTVAIYAKEEILIGEQELFSQSGIVGKKIVTNISEIESQDIPVNTLCLVVSYKQQRSLYAVNTTTEGRIYSKLAYDKGDTMTDMPFYTMDDVYVPLFGADKEWYENLIKNNFREKPSGIYVTNVRSSNFNFVTKLYIIHNLDSKIVTEDITIDACGGYISAYPDMIGNDDAGFIKYKYTYNRTNNTVNLIDNTSITSYELSYSGYRNWEKSREVLTTQGFENRLGTNITGTVSDELYLKANKNEVYTKTEIDQKLGDIETLLQSI